MMKILVHVLAIVLMAATACAEDAQGKNDRGKEDKPSNEVKLDMVSDTVQAVFTKTNAILSGDLEITMTPKAEKRDDYTINAMGQRVPTRTAVKSGSALHTDEPL